MKPTLNTHILQDAKLTPKMVNTKTKTKKTRKMANAKAKIKKTRNTLKTCFSQASKVESTPSGALVGSNIDLVTEILGRLPAFSILRFKSVSKHWRSLLSDRRFTFLYDKVLVSPGLFVRDMYIPFDEENRSIPPFRRLDFYPDRCGIRIVQFCNGLLLCSSHRGKEGTHKYYVFNPTTKQFAVIPPVIGGSNVSKTIRFMGMAFHQTDCVHYKIVCINSAYASAYANREGKVFHIQIYSSDTQKWKVLNQSFSLPYYTLPYYTPISYGVYWNEAIQWAPSCFDLLYFKLDVERLQKLPLPETLDTSRGYPCGPTSLYFGESRGHLHLVVSARHESYLHMNVYEMLRDHSGWFIKYHVELDELPSIYPDMIPSDRDPPLNLPFGVFDVVRGEEEEDTFMVVRIPGKIIKCNILNKSFKKIFDLPNILFYRGIGHMDVHGYTQAISSF